MRIDDGVILTDTQVEAGAEIKPYCVASESVIGPGCKIGPFAHLRPGTELGPDVHVGNFVETKKAVLGRGSKANHLTYLGDAVIGEKVNVGAGTITCNYNGYEKRQTIIEDGAFIGSDSQLVAPVRIGKQAVVAAGTTVTSDVPEGALAITRVEQKAVPGYAQKVADRYGKRRPLAPQGSGAGDRLANLTVTALRSIEAVDAAAGAWDDLLERSRDPEIFLTHAWMRSWWEVFGGEGGRQPLVLLVHDGPQLIGLAPLQVRPVAGIGPARLKRLEFLGTGEDEADEVCSDFLDVVAADGRDDDVCRAVWRYLAEGAEQAGSQERSRVAWDEARFQQGAGRLAADAPAGAAGPGQWPRPGQPGRRRTLLRAARRRQLRGLPARDSRRSGASASSITGASWSGTAASRSGGRPPPRTSACTCRRPPG